MIIYFCRNDVEVFVKLLKDRLPHDVVKSCDILDVPTIAQTADVLIPFSAPIKEEALSSPSLKLVQQFGAGIESVDLEAAKKHNVSVCNIPTRDGGNAVSVAELTIFFMLALARNFREAQKKVAEGTFVGRSVGMALKDKTALIIGFGGIGKALVKRLQSFDMRLLLVSRSAKLPAADYAVDFLGKPSDLPQLLPEADFVILAAPLTEKTKGLIGEQEFNLMKNTAFLINVARGALIDYDAFLDALKFQKISGAGLDVFWQEPMPPNDPIFQYNVIGTPHLGGMTHYSLNQIAEAVAHNIERLRNNQSLLNLIK